MPRVHNFNAGPAALPASVLEQAAKEMLDWNGSGMSVMEMSHRASPFKSIIEHAEQSLRELLDLPQNYRVLFMQGGGTGQFAAVPMNLMHTGSADFIVSGAWSKKALKEAARYGTTHVLASSESHGFACVPDISNIEPTPHASYLYLCLNETIDGVAFSELPHIQDATLIADASSCFLSEPIQISDFGLMWAGAQKNVGPAGVTIVIIRDDLISEPALESTPTILRYDTFAQANSLYNTPPCWSIYMCGLVFDWIGELGGLSAIGKRNHAKAAALYDFLDSSSVFVGRADRTSRSLMNVTFQTADPDLDACFIEQATKAGFVGLKGHRSVGGMRASIYNAVSPQSVDALIDFMKQFEMSTRVHATGVSIEPA